jgi:hypothetical protein
VCVCPSPKRLHWRSSMILRLGLASLFLQAQGVCQDADLPLPQQKVSSREANQGVCSRVLLAWDCAQPDVWLCGCLVGRCCRDLFETRILDRDLSETFADYKDGPDAAKAVTFIKERFRERFESHKQAAASQFHCFELSSRVRMDVRETMKAVRGVLSPMERARSRAAIMGPGRSTRSHGASADAPGWACSACCHPVAAAAPRGSESSTSPSSPAATTAVAGAKGGKKARPGQVAAVSAMETPSSLQATPVATAHPADDDAAPVVAFPTASTHAAATDAEAPSGRPSVSASGGIELN